MMEFHNMSLGIHNIVSHIRKECLTSYYLAARNSLKLLITITHTPYIITHGTNFLKYSFTILMVLTH